jgi:DNA/RNA-binding domain of Phe-tRNA-synthetase-like protein
VTITVHHRLPGEQIALGLLRLSGVRIAPADETLGEAIDRWVARRSAPLCAEEEGFRLASRQMLRNGRYKPTGRGKPASEYLVRAAQSGEFPRINGPVDAINLVSLRHLVPISLWDLERAATDRFEVRLGRAQERYLFNAAGQQLELEDLVCGCGLEGEPGGERSRPMVSPIKDSLATKIQQDTRSVAVCIYYPLGAGDRARLQQIVDEQQGWLERCGGGVEGESATLLPGQSLTF